MAKKNRRRVVPPEELNSLAETATEGTELACALIAGAHIENALGHLLTKVLIPGKPGDPTDRLLNDPLGILSTASGRADMCYCLGLLDKATYDNAKIIAQIRNRFAHSHVPIDFDDPEVKKLYRKLGDPPLVDKHGNPVDAAIYTRLMSKPRQKFVAVALGTFVSIAIVSLYSKARSPSSHSPQCTVSEDGSSVVGAVVYFNE